MTLPLHAAETSPINRTDGFLVGAVVGSALAAATMDCLDAAAVIARLAGGREVTPKPPDAGVRHAATALADGLLEELLGQGVDLHRLTKRWLEWWAHDGFGASDHLRSALNHLQEFDAPLVPPVPPSIFPMAAVLPSALAGASPQAMVAGAFHVAGLLDPNEESALAAVAIVVAASRFLEGRRDFIPDVIAVLRANGASNELLDGVRTIPRDPRTAPPIPRGEEPDPVAATIWLLWIAHHRPRGADEMQAMALVGHVSPAIGAVLGALMGARDGIVNWPDRWLTGAGEDVVLRRGVARRLALR